MTLKDVKVGETAIITDIQLKSPLFFRLLDMGLVPKTPVKVQKIAPLGDPLQIHVRGYELTVRIKDAAKIKVRKE